MVGNDKLGTISIKLSMEMESTAVSENLFTKDKIQKCTNFCGEICVEPLAENNTLSFDGNQFVEFLVTFSVGVASGVVGNYIYNAIHAAAKKLEINGRRTRITEESIAQAIETIREMLNETSSTDNENET